MDKLEMLIHLYRFMGVIGASDGKQTAGRKTDTESLMRIAGREYTVYYDLYGLPVPQRVSWLYWRLA